MATTSYVLNDQHCACIDAVLAQNAQVAKLIQDCRDCGLPVEDALADNTKMRDMAVAIKAKFFPQNP
jgi:hypothetical protein